jgi:hypothetical protein
VELICHASFTWNRCAEDGGVRRRLIFRPNHALRFDEKHATPDLTNPWRGSTKSPASVLHPLYTPRTVQTS